VEINNDSSKCNIFKSNLELTLLKSSVSWEEKGEEWVRGVRREFSVKKP